MLSRVLIADRYSAVYPNETKFIQSLIDAVNIEWRRAGQKGAALIAASYEDGVGFLETSAGKMPLTIEDVRAYIRESAVQKLVAR
jgi:hypothetical protein